MGFGQIFLGYLLTYILYLTGLRLGIGSLFLLGGTVLFHLGFSTLEKYQPTFFFGRFLTYPLLLLSLYRLFTDAEEWLSLSLLDAPWISAFADWMTFALMMGMNFVILRGVYLLSKEVGLLHIGAKAIRNGILIGLYAVLYLLSHLEIWSNPTFVSYLTVPTVLCQVLMVLFQLLLLLSCMKNICPKGEEDPTPKRYRWEILNRIGDTFEANLQKASDSTKEYREEQLRKKRTKRSKKN